jgi:hypothetical protein
MLRLQLCLLFLFGLVSAIAIPNHQTRSVQNSTANYFMADSATWYTISRTIGDTTTALTSFQPGSEEDATILLQPSTSMTADVSMLVKFQLYPVTAEPNGTYIIRAETHVGRYMSSTFPSTNDMSEVSLAPDTILFEIYQKKTAVLSILVYRAGLELYDWGRAL